MNDNLRGIFDLHKCSDTSDGTPNTILSTPGGRPASIKALPIAIAVPGVSSLGLIVIVQPAAKAPPILRTTFMTGKFQATKAMTGPIGSLMTVCDILLILEGTILPYALFPSSPYHLKTSKPTASSPFASATGFPISTVRLVAT